MRPSRDKSVIQSLFTIILRCQIFSSRFLPSCSNSLWSGCWRLWNISTVEQWYFSSDRIPMSLLPMARGHYTDTGDRRWIQCVMVYDGCWSLPSRLGSHVTGLAGGGYCRLHNPCPRKTKIKIVSSFMIKSYFIETTTQCRLNVKY